MDWALADARFCGTNLGSAHVQELLAVFKETEPVVLAALGALAPTDKVVRARRAKHLHRGLSYFCCALSKLCWRTSTRTRC